MKTILFVSYGGGHITNLLPLIEIFNKKNDVKVIVLALTTAQEFLDLRNINYIGYKDLPFELPASFYKLAMEIVARMNDKKISESESVAYHAWNIWDLVIQFGNEHYALEKFSIAGRSCFYPINFMQKILIDFRPNLVIATSSPRSERAVLDAASTLGIPSICVLDMAVNLEIGSWLNNNNFCNFLCAPNEKIKQQLVHHGRIADSIYVTGAPALDDYQQQLSANEINNFKTSIGITSNKKIILYAPSPESEKHLFTGKKGDVELPFKILQLLIDYVKNKTNVILIFRPHPSMKFEKPRNVDPNIIYDINFYLKNVLSASDLVITTASSVGIQALIMKKKLICMNMSIYSNDLNYEEYGECTRVNSIDNVYKVLDLELSAVEHREPHIFATENLNATTKIVNLINGIL